MKARKTLVKDRKIFLLAYSLKYSSGGRMLGKQEKIFKDFLHAERIKVPFSSINFKSFYLRNTKLT